MKKVISIFLTLVLALNIFACAGSASKATESGSGAGAQTETKNETKKTVLHWARANSGNVFVTIAKNNGYFADYNIEVIEDPLNSTADALTALGNGQVQATSNNGTNNPLAYIAKGQDFTMVGGYMLKGMYIVAKAGTKWNGPEDLIGKKFAGPANQTAITGALLKLGHDPVNEVEWLTYSTNNDRLTAVVKGEADYAILSGDLLSKVESMKNQIEIVAWADDLTPNYGCCRLNMQTNYVKENPEIVKNMLKALLRAECFLNHNKDESVKMLAKEIGADEDYVSAYLKNPNYVPSVDPVRKSIIETWNVMVQTGFVAEDVAKSINVEDHINTTLYKQALDELLKEYAGTSDEAFYKEREAFFKENN